MEEIGGVRLNLGSGSVHWPGWIGCDLSGADVDCDIRNLPFPNDYADAIAAIHVVEHLHSWELLDTLRGWYRVLKPGGQLILELPCMNKVFGVIAHAVQKGNKIPQGFVWAALYGKQDFKRPEMCHKYAYSIETLSALVAQAGFTDVFSCEPRYHFKERDMRIEATKPC